MKATFHAGTDNSFVNFLHRKKKRKKKEKKRKRIKKINKRKKKEKQVLRSRLGNTCYKYYVNSKTS